MFHIMLDIVNIVAMLVAKANYIMPLAWSVIFTCSAFSGVIII